MDVTEYANAALRTADPVQTDRTCSTAEKIIAGPQKELLLGGLGLVGEAGEVAELIKKHVFHDRPLDREKLIKEMGDVLWYLNCLAVRCCQVSLTDVMDANIAKLRARYPEGRFSVERSIHRAPTDV